MLFRSADISKDEEPLIPDVIVNADKAVKTLYEIAAKAQKEINNGII